MIHVKTIYKPRTNKFSKFLFGKYAFKVNAQKLCQIFTFLSNGSWSNVG